jgi:predicted SAM-dependent methyltransferase
VVSSGISVSPEGQPIRRLNWGCGSHVASGWINSDIKDGAGIDLVADIREGLPLADESMDCVVSVHALPEFAYPEIGVVLAELRRVLVPGGVLRLVLPDLLKGIEAFQRGDPDYFLVDPAEVSSPGGRFVVHMLWYGYSRTLFTVDFVEELLAKAGFVDVTACSFRQTESDFSEIIELDNRPRESMYVEARRGRSEPRKADGHYNPPVAAQGEVQIGEFAHSTPNDRVHGHFRVERVDKGLALIGWALGVESPVIRVEVVSGGEVVASTSPAVERPDIEQAFPDVPGAGTCGFELTIEPSGSGKSHLLLQAALEDGELAPLGELEVISRARRRGLFRRGG